MYLLPLSRVVTLCIGCSTRVRSCPAKIRSLFSLLGVVVGAWQHTWWQWWDRVPGIYPRLSHPSWKVVLTLLGWRTFWERLEDIGRLFLVPFFFWREARALDLSGIDRDTNFNFSPYHRRPPPWAKPYWSVPDDYHQSHTRISPHTNANR